MALGPPTYLNDAYGEFDTPNGRIMIPRDQFASFGIQTPEEAQAALAGNAGLPPAPLPPEAGHEAAQLQTGQVAPVPAIAQDDALAPPAADATSGVAPIVPTGQPAAQPIAGPAKTAVPVPGAEAAAAPVAPQEQQAAPDLSKVSYGDVLQQQQAALAQEAQAAQGVGEAEAAKMDAQAAAMAERDRALAAKEAEVEQARKDDEAKLAQKEQTWQAKNDEWMNAKVKRRGIGTMEMIGIALSGLGSAWKGQGDKNPALDLVMAKIQQDVDDQVRERDELGKRAGALKGALDYAREIATSRNSQRLAAIGMEAQRWGREIETIGAKMDSPIKKQQALAQGAAIKSKGAEFLAQGVQLARAEDRQKEQFAAQQAQQERESKRAAGVQYARIAQEDRQFAANRQDRLVKEANDNAFKLADINREIAAAAQRADPKALEVAKFRYQQEKDLQERSVGFMRPVTKRDAQGKPTGVEWAPLTNADGKKYPAPDQKRAQDVGKKLEATTQYVDAVDRLEELRERHGSEWFKTDGARQMMVNYQTAVVRMKDAFGLGALSGPDQALAQGAIGTDDPTEWRGISAGLQESRKRSIRDMNLTLRSNEYTGDDFDIPNLTSQGLKEKAGTGERGRAVESLTEGARSKTRGAQFVAEGSAKLDAGGIKPTADLLKSESAQIGQLIAGAQSGDVSARAGLARLTRDRVLGLPTLTMVADSGLQAGDFVDENGNPMFRPEEWKMVEGLRAYSSQLRNLGARR